jgi:hypothetical protein
VESSLLFFHRTFQQFSVARIQGLPSFEMG